MLKNQFFISKSERQNRESTDFLEFQKGKFSGYYWTPDSLNIQEEDFYELALLKLFCDVIPEFDMYGVTIVSKEAWETLKRKAMTTGKETRRAFRELEVWVECCFQEQDCFSVVGL